MIRRLQITATARARLGVLILASFPMTGPPALSREAPAAATPRALVEPIYRCNQANCRDPMISSENLPYSTTMRRLTRRQRAVAQRGQVCIGYEPMFASNSEAGVGEEFRIVGEYTRKSRAGLTVLLRPGGHNVIAPDLTKEDGTTIGSPQRSITWYFVRENGRWVVDDILTAVEFEGAYILQSFRQQLENCE